MQTASLKVFKSFDTSFNLSAYQTVELHLDTAQVCLHTVYKNAEMNLFGAARHTAHTYQVIFSVFFLLFFYSVFNELMMTSNIHNSFSEAYRTV